MRQFSRYQKIMDELHAGGIQVATAINPAERKDKFRGFNLETGNFELDPFTGCSFRFYEADIDNDGPIEYVLVGQCGSGQWFDINAVYKRSGNKFKDVYPQIKSRLKQLYEDYPPGKDYDPDGDVGIYQGSILFEKEGGRTYFWLVGPSGQWFEIDNAHPDGGRWVRQRNPAMTKYLWDKTVLRELETARRPFDKRVDTQTRRMLEADAQWLTMPDEERSRMMRQWEREAEVQGNAVGSGE